MYINRQMIFADSQPSSEHVQLFFFKTRNCITYSALHVFMFVHESFLFHFRVNCTDFILFQNYILGILMALLFFTLLDSLCCYVHTFILIFFMAMEYYFIKLNFFNFLSLSYFRVLKSFHFPG